MSKRDLKKYIDSIDAAQLRAVILEAYSARREIKEYFDFFIEPDSKKLAEKYRKKIRAEFVTRTNHLKRHPRRSVCKKALAEMRCFSPEPEALVDVTLLYVELSDIWMRFMPSSLANNMAQSVADTLCEAIDIVFAEGLISQFENRIKTLIYNAHLWGQYDLHNYIEAHINEAQSKSMSALLARSVKTQEDE